MFRLHIKTRTMINRFAKWCVMLATFMRPLRELFLQRAKLFGCQNILQH